MYEPMLVVPPGKTATRGGPYRSSAIVERIMQSFEIVLIEWETTQANRRRGGRGDTGRLYTRRGLSTGTGLDGEILTRIYLLCLAIVITL